MSEPLDWSGLEAHAEDANVVPLLAGVTCEACGVCVEVPWDERETLQARVDEHVCPNDDEDDE